MKSLVRVSEEFNENEKLFWKKVKKERQGEGGRDFNVKNKREDVVCISSREVKEIWKSHFECLTNEKTEKEAILSSMGMEAGVCRKIFIAVK